MMMPPELLDDGSALSASVAESGDQTTPWDHMRQSSLQAHSGQSDTMQLAVPCAVSATLQLPMSREVMADRDCDVRACSREPTKDSAAI